MNYIMKVVGIAFSSREKGNCTRFSDYCLNIAKNYGHQTELINLSKYNIQGCDDCDYRCFENEGCCKNDDTSLLYKRCFDADKVIFAIPTFGGHLSSAYFRFAERSQGIFKNEDEYENKFLKKINLIVIGNLTSGGDMALHEALYCFSNRNFYPESILIQSREYGKSSINGDLIEVIEVRNRLERFSKKILNKI